MKTGTERAEQSEAREAPHRDKDREPKNMSGRRARCFPPQKTETPDREPTNMSGRRATRAKRGGRGAPRLHIQRRQTESRTTCPGTERAERSEASEAPLCTLIETEYQHEHEHENQNQHKNGNVFGGCMHIIRTRSICPLVESVGTL